MENLSLKFGSRMFLGIGIFFVVTNFLGFGHIAELRVVNVFIIVYFSSKLANANLIKDSKVSYLSNLVTIFAANFINVMLSLIGFVIYVKLINTEYLALVAESMTWMGADSLTEIMIALFMEGMAGAAVVSFGVMQYFKNVKRVTTKVF